MLKEFFRVLRDILAGALPVPEWVGYMLYLMDRQQLHMDKAKAAAVAPLEPMTDQDWIEWIERQR